MLKKIFLSALMGLVLVLLLYPVSAFCGDALHKAAAGGDLETVKRLLAGAVDADERDSFGGTALHAAMFQKNSGIIKILIEKGFST